MDSPVLRVRSLVVTAQFSALIAVGGLMAIPVGPVPFTLQTLFVYLAGLCLGPQRALAAVLVYISAGAFGLPVFAGGKAGIGVFFGPTAGYLAGFIIAAMLAGLAGRNANKALWKTALGLLAAILSLHTCGMTGMVLVLGMPVGKALTIGLPFIPVDLVKGTAALFIWRSIKSRGFVTA